MLIEILKTNGTIKYDTDFCESIGLRKQNLYNIRQGKNYFTPEHIEKAIKTYKVNANWIFSVSDRIFRTDTIVPKPLKKTDHKLVHKKPKIN